MAEPWYSPQALGALLKRSAGAVGDWYESLPSAGEQIMASGQRHADAYDQGGVRGLLAQGIDADSPVAGAFAGSTIRRMGGPIRAYHGSPHDFDKFDAAKIGTGEGAQAYGHGLYFAENEGVARSYRDLLAKPTADRPLWRHKGEPVLVGNDHYQLALALENATPKHGETSADVLARRIAAMDDQYEFARKVYGEDTAGMYRRNADVLRAIDPSDLTRHEPGRMYEVNIHADPAKMLDWDKPLSQQPSALQEIAQNADLSHLKPGNRTRVMMERYLAGTEEPHNPTLGHQFYNALYDYGGKSSADLTSKLSHAGIPGIKYLDGGSRAAGEGSRNYVVFDPSIIEIIRKYGVGGLTAAAASGAITSEQAEAAHRTAMGMALKGAE